MSSVATFPPPLHSSPCDTKMKSAILQCSRKRALSAECQTLYLNLDDGNLLPTHIVLLLCSGAVYEIPPVTVQTIDFSFEIKFANDQLRGALHFFAVCLQLIFFVYYQLFISINNIPPICGTAAGQCRNDRHLTLLGSSCNAFREGSTRANLPYNATFSWLTSKQQQHTGMESTGVEVQCSKSVSTCSTELGV